MKLQTLNDVDPLPPDPVAPYIPRCQFCMCDVQEAAQRGAYFARTNPTGERGKWKCVPSCAPVVKYRTM